MVMMSERLIGQVVIRDIQPGDTRLPPVTGRIIRRPPIIARDDTPLRASNAVPSFWLYQQALDVWGNITDYVLAADWGYGSSQQNRIGGVMRGGEGSITLNNDGGEFDAFNPNRHIDPHPGAAVEIWTTAERNAEGGQLLFKGDSRGIVSGAALAEANDIAVLRMRGAMARLFEVDDGLSLRLTGQPTTTEAFVQMLRNQNWPEGRWVLGDSSLKLHSVRLNAGRLVQGRRRVSWRAAAQLLGTLEGSWIYDDRNGVIHMEDYNTSRQEPLPERRHDITEDKIIYYRPLESEHLIVNQIGGKADVLLSRGNAGIGDRLGFSFPHTWEISPRHIRTITMRPHLAQENGVNTELIDSWGPFDVNRDWTYTLGEFGGMPVVPIFSGDETELNIQVANPSNDVQSFTLRREPLAEILYSTGGGERLGYFRTDSIQRYGVKNVEYPADVVVDQGQIRTRAAAWVNELCGIDGDGNAAPLLACEIRIRYEGDEIIGVRDLVRLTHSNYMGKRLIEDAPFWVDRVKHEYFTERGAANHNVLLTLRQAWRQVGLPAADEQFIGEVAVGRAVSERLIGEVGIPLEMLMGMVDIDPMRLERLMGAVDIVARERLIGEVGIFARLEMLIGQVMLPPPSQLMGQVGIPALMGSVVIPNEALIGEVRLPVEMLIGSVAIEQLMGAVSLDAELLIGEVGIPFERLMGQVLIEQLMGAIELPAPPRRPYWQRGYVVPERARLLFGMRPLAAADRGGEQGYYIARSSSAAPTAADFTASGVQVTPGGSFTGRASVPIPAVRSVRITPGTSIRGYIRSTGTAFGSASPADTNLSRVTADAGGRVTVQIDQPNNPRFQNVRIAIGGHTIFFGGWRQFTGGWLATAHNAAAAAIVRGSAPFTVSASIDLKPAGRTTAIPTETIDANLFGVEVARPSGGTTYVTPATRSGGRWTIGSTANVTASSVSNLGELLGSTGPVERPEALVGEVAVDLPVPQNVRWTNSEGGQFLDVTWDAVPGATQYGLVLLVDGVRSSNFNTSGTSGRFTLRERERRCQLQIGVRVRRPRQANRRFAYTEMFCVEVLMGQVNLPFEALMGSVGIEQQLGEVLIPARERLMGEVMIPLPVPQERLIGQVMIPLPVPPPTGLAGNWSAPSRYDFGGVIRIAASVTAVTGASQYEFEFSHAVQTILSSEYVWTITDTDNQAEGSANRDGAWANIYGMRVRARVTVGGRTSDWTSYVTIAYQTSATPPPPPEPTPAPTPTPTERLMGQVTITTRVAPPPGVTVPEVLIGQVVIASVPQERYMGQVAIPVRVIPERLIGAVDLPHVATSQAEANAVRWVTASAASRSASSIFRGSLRPNPANGGIRLIITGVRLNGVTGDFEWRIRPNSGNPRVDVWSGWMDSTGASEGGRITLYHYFASRPPLNASYQYQVRFTSGRYTQTRAAVTISVGA